jgi:hypothetical protein
VQRLAGINGSAIPWAQICPVHRLHYTKRGVIIKVPGHPGDAWAKFLRRRELTCGLALAARGGDTSRSIPLSLDGCRPSPITLIWWTSVRTPSTS